MTEGKSCDQSSTRKQEITYRVVGRTKGLYSNWLKCTATVRFSIFSGLPSGCQLCYWTCLSGYCSNIRICQRAHNSHISSERLSCLPRNQTRFPSERQRLCGSFEAEWPQSAKTMSLAIRSFKVWCLARWSGPSYRRTHYYYYYCYYLKC